MLFKNSKKRVLVSGGDKDFLSVTQALLEFAKLKADTAEDGEEALKKIKKHKYDLLILHVVMPKIDGIKLSQMAKKSQKYAEVPVLFVSDYSSKDVLEVRQREIIERANGYLQKPFKTKVFLDKVKALLEKQSPC